MKIGLLFSGQGAQYSGMGKNLYEHSAAAKRVFDDAGDQIKDWCFNGSSETLKQTHITQPSIYTVSMAACEAFFEAMSKQDSFFQSFEISGVAGFSLGEYTALTAAGVIDDLKKGLDIVKKRGALMFEAGLDAQGNPKGGMMAALGKREKILACVESVRENGILEGVNFNSPQQTVVAGEFAALERFKEKAAESRIKAIPLSVGTAFHSPMMQPAAEPLRQILLSADLKMPKYTIYCNVTGKDLFEGQKLSEDEIPQYVADVMARQAKSPVYWQETIENMIRDGIEAVIEFGPGSTLCGFAKKISSNLLVLNVEDQDSLVKTLESLLENLKEKGE